MCGEFFFYITTHPILQTVAKLNVVKVKENAICLPANVIRVQQHKRKVPPFFIRYIRP